MKSAKEDLKNNEINNNIRSGYLSKERPFDHSTGQRKGNFPKCESSKSEPKKAKDSHRSPSIELADLQPLFEPLNSQTEEVELQKLIYSIKDGSTSDGTMSRKQSVVSQDSNKYGKRKISTVLELKDYKWTEEQDSTSISSAERINFKRLKQLEAAFATADQEADQAKRKKHLKNTERNRTWALILMLAFLILSMVAYSNYLEKDLKFKNSLEYRIVFRDKELRTFDLLDDNGRSVLTVHYGLKIPKDIKPVKCSKLSKGAKVSYFCRDWLHRATLIIGVDNKPQRINCYNIEWVSYTSKEELKDCFDLKNGYWFGMGLVDQTPWPLNTWNQAMAPFVTSDTRNKESPFGSIIRRYWLSSDGVSIGVPLDVPLHMSFNETRPDGKQSNQMCFQANLAHYPYDAETSVKLEYSICTGDDLKQLHQVSSKVWSQASIAFDLDKSPEMEFIRKPIWTTSHLPELNQVVLQQFTKQINDITNVTGFLLIDDRWQNRIGELRMNQTRFPNPVDTFKALTNRGWKSILTVSPLINIVSDLLREISYQKRIIQDMTLQVPLLTKCSPDEQLNKFYSRFCAVVDIMQPSNGEWLKRRLIENTMGKFSIDGLMFTGIEVSRMPQAGHHNQLHNVTNPDYYQVYYIDIAASTSKYIGMTVAAGIKDVQGFLRIPKLSNTWESLNSIIPTILNLGVVGYGVVNTGSVGGDIELGPKDDELYVRWLELTLFLPIIQFSKVENINSLSIDSIKTLKKYQHIRKTDLIPVFEKCMMDYNQNGWPIIRPLWWLEPDDQDLYLIKDQFAIGDEIIVAPILNKRQTRRNITLPSGIWLDMINLRNEKGGKTLQNYEISLNQIAYFKKVKE